MVTQLATAPSVSDPATERFAAALAPLPLQRVQSFLNTRSAGLPVEPDLLARPASANSWLGTFDSKYNSKPTEILRWLQLSRSSLSS
jgi:hypothetical protein